MNRLRRMEIFRAVVEAGKFSAGAENLGLSNSAVSQAISDIEAYLGTQLINRDNRKFQLTSDGEAYYRQCCHILSELSAIENIYRQEKSVVDGPISITAPITFGVSKVAPVLDEFLHLNPKVQLSLSLAEHNMDLVQAGLDIAIRIGNLNNSSLKIRKLSDVQLVLCASPEFLEKCPPLKHVKDLELVNTLRYRWTPKWKFTRGGETYIFTPKGTITSDSGEALLEFTIGGQGLSFLPEFIAEPALKSGSLTRVLQNYDGETLPIHLVYPPNRHRPARVEKLSDFMVEKFTEMDGKRQNRS